MLINKIYLSNYFSNILEEKWLFKNEVSLDLDISRLPRIGEFYFKDPVQKSSIKFNYDKVETIIFDEHFKNEHYIIGKCPSYYFLAIRKNEDDYPWVSILKNMTFSPLVKEITFFKEMFPSSKTGEFARTLLLKHQLENDLLKKNSTKPKVNKI